MMMTPAQRRRIWLENVSQAFQTIRSHKFRSFLTVLGVFIGIVTVVLVASILTGMRGNLVKMIEQYGTSNIYAFHLETGIRTGPPSRREWQRKPLRVEFGETIRRRCPAVDSVGYFLIPRNFSGPVKYQGNEYKDGEFRGVSPGYFDTTSIEIALGRPLNEADDDHRIQNCVLGPEVAKALFPFSTPVGKEVLIAGKAFIVVGVAAKQKTTFFGENEEDNMIYFPFKTLQRVSPQDDWVMLVIKAKEGMLQKALDQSEQVLRSERKLKAADENDFSMSTSESIISQFDNITAGVGLVTIAISAVGLMVGGIGVMNILLVSVKERTREIGVRKAIGARRKDITIQFLIEAMTLTGMGGLAGILAATTLGMLISALFPAIPAVIPLWAVTTALVLSVLIGLAFGVWPATRAARLDPIECLHYE
ncbi:MAG: ABC transporter permease [Acidobacteria bacterium]|nr:ABC transporter permease [Acidobacteriota bacterium]